MRVVNISMYKLGLNGIGCTRECRVKCLVLNFWNFGFGFNFSFSVLFFFFTFYFCCNLHRPGVVAELLLFVK